MANIHTQPFESTLPAGWTFDADFAIQAGVGVTGDCLGTTKTLKNVNASYDTTDGGAKRVSAQAMVKIPATPGTSNEVFVLLKKTAATTYYAAALMLGTADPSGLVLWKRVAGSWTQLGTGLAKTLFSTNAWYLVKVISRNGLVIARVQRASDSLWLDATGTWQANERNAITFADTAISSTADASAGLLVFTNGTPSGATLIDNFSFDTIAATTAPASVPISRNSDAVRAGPYTAAIAGTANIGSAGSSIEWINVGQTEQIAQAGTITAVQMYIQTKTNVSSVKVTVWRKNGATYDLVATSEELLASLTAGALTTVTLSTPITGVQLGDYMGARIATSNASVAYAPSGLGAAHMHYVADAAAAGTGYNWDAASALNGYACRWNALMQAPALVAIGDSLLGGWNLSSPFTTLTYTTAWTAGKDPIDKLATLLSGLSYQNKSIGAQTTAQMLARFQEDVVNRRPATCLILAGVNDVDGAVAEATIKANLAAMYEWCASEGITPLAIKILPWTNGDHTEHQTIDSINTWLTTEVPADGGIVVDASSTLGQFHTGGDAGNLWDIKETPDYNDDGVHYSEAGYTALAGVLASAYDSTPPTASSTINGTTLTITFSENVTGASASTHLQLTQDGEAYAGEIASASELEDTDTWTITLDTAVPWNATFGVQYVTTGSGDIVDGASNAMVQGAIVCTNITPDQYIWDGSANAWDSAHWENSAGVNIGDWPTGDMSGYDVVIEGAAAPTAGPGSETTVKSLTTNAFAGDLTTTILSTNIVIASGGTLRIGRVGQTQDCAVDASAAGRIVLRAGTFSGKAKLSAVKGKGSVQMLM